jgi:hypothetical protein
MRLRIGLLMMSSEYPPGKIREKCSEKYIAQKYDLINKCISSRKESTQLSLDVVRKKGG